MKKLIIFLLLVSSLGFAAPAKSTKGYVKKNGTYVAPSHHTAPNATKTDNYTHQGNVNPYTGKKGTKK